jgi:hypothetical protein
MQFPLSFNGARRHVMLSSAAFRLLRKLQLPYRFFFLLIFDLDNSFFAY